MTKRPRTVGEAALIRAAAHGSSRAWDRLVRRHEQQVYNFALRLTGNPADARDVMQDVFLGVWRNLHSFRGDSAFSSWLFRIAHNKAVDLRRRQRWLATRNIRPGAGEPGDRDNDGGGDYDEMKDESRPGPMEQVLSDEASDRILALLQCLPETQRRVVELKFYQELTFEQIAALESVSANTAKTRFYTALRRLGRELEHTDE